MRKRGFALSLGLPEDATSDCARVTLSGQSAALVEGQHGVIELTESRVRLRTGRGVLTVQGEGLRLRALSVDAGGAPTRVPSRNEDGTPVLVPYEEYRYFLKGSRVCPGIAHEF